MGTTVRFLSRAVMCGVLLASVVGFTAEPAIAATTTSVSGVVFGDANSSGTPNTGEGLRASISFSGGTTTAVKSSASGSFKTRLAPGTYYVSGGVGRQWYLVGRIVVVRAAALHLNLRAVHPLGKVLSASMHFTSPSYKPRDVVHLVVTVRNTGTRLLRGVGAECDAGGFPGELANSNSGWGPLKAYGQGLTLPAHSTRTLTVVDRVPPGAPQVGQVSAGCTFGYDGVDAGYRPVASAKAAVPGQTGSLAGTVSQGSATAPGLAGVHVVLVNSRACPTVRQTAITDAQGAFRFTGIPASYYYLLYFSPPAGWRIRDENPGTAEVFGNSTANLFIRAQRGTTSVPEPPSVCAPR